MKKLPKTESIRLKRRNNKGEKLIKKEESTVPFGDRPYSNPDCRLHECSWRLRTMLTVRAGEMVYRDELF